MFPGEFQFQWFSHQFSNCAFFEKILFCGLFGFFQYLVISSFSWQFLQCERLFFSYAFYFFLPKRPLKSQTVNLSFFFPTVALSPQTKIDTPHPFVEKMGFFQSPRSNAPHHPYFAGLVSPGPYTRGEGSKGGNSPRCYGTVPKTVSGTAMDVGSRFSSVCSKQLMGRRLKG